MTKKVKKYALIALVFFAFVFSTHTYAKTIYVSSNGLDKNNGLSTESPLRTLSALQKIVDDLSKGDQILFERGGKYYGSLTLNNKDNITISAYGTGTKPILHGWETVKNWTNEGNGIYSATIKINGRNMQVSFNGLNQEMGRSDYYYFDGGNRTAIFDKDFKADQNLVGVELVSNNKDWTKERQIIKSLNDGEINISGEFYNYPVSGNKDNWYFFQNSSSFLTDIGDWNCNFETGKIYMYFGSEIPGKHEIKITSIENILSIPNSDNLNISDIDIQGAYYKGIDASYSDYLSVNNCDFSFCFHGVSAYYSDHNTITNCLFQDISSVAIRYPWRNDDCLFSNNTITRVGLFPGLSHKFGTDDGTVGCVGISHRYADNVLIKNNTITNCGYTAIGFTTNNAIVEYNYIDSVMLVTRDGGGIYTGGSKHRDKIIRYNIIDHTPGVGIYLDERCHYTQVYGNSVFNTEMLFQNHKGSNNKIYNNTFYNSSYRGIYFLCSSTDPIAQTDSNYFANNVIVTFNDVPIWVAFANAFPIDNFGTIDSNIYIYSGNDINSFHCIDRRKWSTKTFKEWQAVGYDSNTDLIQASTQYYYNNTLKNKVIQFPGQHKTDVYDNNYKDYLILAPFKSIVIKDTKAHNDSIEIPTEPETIEPEPNEKEPIEPETIEPEPNEPETIEPEPTEKEPENENNTPNLDCTSSGNTDATFNYINAVPFLDGDPSDEVWTNALVTVIHPELPYQSEKPSVDATVKVFWNDTAFCVLVIGQDNVWQPSWVSGLGTWKSDLVELYFDVNENLTDGLGPSSNAGHWHIAPNFPQKEAGKSTTVKINEQNVYIGGNWDSKGYYAMEYIIPFKVLTDADGNAYNPYNRCAIGFDVTLIDNDDGATRQRQVWKNIGKIGESWINMDKCGIVSLSKTDVGRETVSLEASILENQTQIYPNPFTSTIGIYTDNDITYSIYNYNGALVEQGQSFGNCFVGQNLNTGFYILQVNDKYSIFSERIIKQ